MHPFIHRPIPTVLLATTLFVLLACRPWPAAARGGHPPVGEPAGPRGFHVGVAVEERLAAGADALTRLAADRPADSLAARVAAAWALAVFPGVLKTEVGPGGHRGSGMIVRRARRGAWGDPVFVRLTGGDLEPVVGPDPTDLVLLFEETAGIERLLADDVTVDTDAAGSGNPLAERPGASADLTAAAAVRCYARTDAGFVVVDLVAARLESDVSANHDVYGAAASPRTILDGGLDPPDVVEEFMAAVRAMR